MTQDEIQGQGSAHLCKTQRSHVQARVFERVQELQNRCSVQLTPDETARPDTRSPYDPWHSEAYLIGCLVKTHGWTVTEPGTIRRFRRP
jgi:hypothetical protein